MAYTPTPPMAQPARKDNTALFGWIGIIGGLCSGLLGLIFGALSITQARKWGQPPVLGYVGITIGLLNIIGSINYHASR